MLEEVEEQQLENTWKLCSLSKLYTLNQMQWINQTKTTKIKLKQQKIMLIKVFNSNKIF